MKKFLNRAVFFLALIVISLSLTVNSYAAGDEQPTPTPEEEVKDTEKGGEVSPYGIAPYGEPVYGGGIVTPKKADFLADKMVKNPSTGSFVDHLGPTDPKYRPLDIVVFQVKVNNPGDETLDVLEAVDTLPEFVDFMTGPGNFNPENRQLTFQVEGLEGGETRNFEIKARVSHQSTLPEEKNIICPVNVIEAVVGDKTDRDESQFCIEKEMVAPQVPEAGASQWLMAFLGSALLAGIILRKKAFLST